MKPHHQFPFHLMITIIILVFFLEILIMLVLPLFPPLPPPIGAFLNSTLLVIFLCPLLFACLFRPTAREMGRLMETERSLRNSEMKLQHISRQVPALLWTTNRDLRFTSSMGNRYGVFDIQEHEVVGTTLYEYFQVNDPEFYPIKMHRRALRGESVQYDFEWNDHFFDTNLVPFHDAEGNITGIIGIALDVTDRKQTEGALRKSEMRLRDLTARIAKVTEEERKNLARELHDRVGQNLTALNINLNIIKNHLSGISTGDLKARLSDAMELVEETARRIRDVMAELRPAVLDDYGLLAALRWYGERFSKRTGLAVEVTGEQSSGCLPPDTETTLFRIAQEAMLNVVKHAGADRISLSLESSADTTRLTIADNGAGFDPAAAEHPELRHGWGLISMQERANSVGGNLRVESSPEKGTKVIVLVPGY